MSKINVKATVPVLGFTKGEVVEVDDSTLVQTMLHNGYLERVPDDELPKAAQDAKAEAPAKDGPSDATPVDETATDTAGSTEPSTSRARGKAAPAKES